MRGFLILALGACSTAAPAMDAGAVPWVDLPGGSGGVGFDDLRFSTKLRKVVSAPGGTGNVDLVDPDSFAITSIGGLDPGAMSADEGNGLVFLGDRTNSSIVVVDPAARRIVATAPLGGGPDYVRFSPATSEVWVTQPGGARIEVLSVAANGSLTHAAFVAIPDGPEGLAFDVSRRRAFTHGFLGKLEVIDVDARMVVATWPTGCTASHGIPAVDERRGFVFAGCSERAKVVVLDQTKDGAVLGSVDLGPASGETILAYAPGLGHFYLRGDPGAPVAMLGVSNTGQLSMLETVNAAEKGHCMIADDRGAVWVCDTQNGRLLRFADSHPTSH